MLYGDLQFFDIIIFAGIALFLIYRLRSVLGKRSGHQPNQTVEKKSKQTFEKIKKEIPQLKDNEQKLNIIYEKVENFDHKIFLEGAKKAFEIIITAYNEGDKKTLKPLVSKDVYLAFEKAINDKLNDQNSQFYSLVVDGIEDAKIFEDKMIITVIFTSEQFRNSDESKITKKQDNWTFEKKISSQDPLWILTST